MKMVIAVIQPDKLADVKDALVAAKITKMTASNVIGCGQQMGYTETEGYLWYVKLGRIEKVEE